ncbi:MAG: DUF924 family protein [Pseudomonadota bacterium]|nr:DUF924 family protein [Pseudomonadota bacterium]
MTTPGPDDILLFWFGSADLRALPSAATQKRWFTVDPAFDAELAARFGALLDDPEAVEAWATRAGGGGAAGTLAAILTLDQLPRNIFRGRARAFATDARALRLATATVAAKLDRELGLSQRVFAYLPFEHAEDIASQNRSVALFTALAADSEGAASYVAFAESHRATIARFGRFPGRNAALGRTDTPEEAAYLAEGGQTWGQASR